MTGKSSLCEKSCCLTPPVALMSEIDRSLVYAPPDAFFAFQEKNSECHILVLMQRFVVCVTTLWTESSCFSEFCLDMVLCSITVVSAPDGLMPSPGRQACIHSDPLRTLACKHFPSHEIPRLLYHRLNEDGTYHGHSGAWISHFQVCLQH
jgi:hypothetical protein